jgi:GNAT superfamily N-acetyltransferase
MWNISPITPDAQGIDALIDESLEEGYRMLRRLKENWDSGLNRFEGPGEILVEARLDGVPIGICGRNIDPFANDPTAGRVRHLYVARDHRQMGVGKALVRFICNDASHFFKFLNTRATPQAYKFYEHLGFSPVPENSTVTHRLYF